MSQATRAIRECRYCHGRIVGTDALWVHIADEPTDHPAAPARQASR